MAVGRSLVQAHRIGERHFEQIIVTDSLLSEDIRQPNCFAGAEFVQRDEVASGKDHNLEWPCRPERKQRDEVFVLANDAFTRLLLEGQIVAQQT